MEKRAAEIMAQIVGADPVCLPSGEWALLWPDEHGADNLVTIEFDKDNTPKRKIDAPDETSE